MSSKTQALLYFWKILDIHKQGFLDHFTLDFFLRDIVQGCQDLGYERVDMGDIRDEIYDMISPENGDKITFEDLSACSLCNTIVR